MHTESDIERVSQKATIFQSHSSSKLFISGHLFTSKKGPTSNILIKYDEYSGTTGRQRARKKTQIYRNKFIAKFPSNQFSKVQLIYSFERERGKTSKTGSNGENDAREYVKIGWRSRCDCITNTS